ncbi:hypothetical protein D3C86_1403550 [compost metagenome]
MKRRHFDAQRLACGQKGRHEQRECFLSLMSDDRALRNHGSRECKTPVSCFECANKLWQLDTTPDVFTIKKQHGFSFSIKAFRRYGPSSSRQHSCLSASIHRHRNPGDKRPGKQLADDPWRSTEKTQRVRDNHADRLHTRELVPRLPECARTAPGSAFTGVHRRRPQPFPEKAPSAGLANTRISTGNHRQLAHGIVPLCFLWL